MKRILVVNGPNLNFLGIRNPEQYGSDDYQNLEAKLYKSAEKLDISVEIYQSNIEGEIVDKLQEAYREGIDGIVINAGAYSHYSIAIRDALEVFDIPIIEVHISNIYKREEFRHISVIAPVCTGQITGLGLEGYVLALQACTNNEKNS